MSLTNEPLIPHTTKLPEITIKAIVIGLLLAVILAATNAYLGLKVGTTISASIPAAVIAMGVLHFFRNHNVLENNIIQTSASAGEALVGGLIFTTPALLILKFWFNFPYVEMVVIALVGGILGILFSALLRRILLADKSLHFPEGVAIGNVLKASADKTIGLKYLVHGGAVGFILTVVQSGLGVISDGLFYWRASSTAIFGFGFDFAPAVLAAGYIVGVNVAIGCLVGVIVGYFIGIPYFSAHYGFNPADLSAAVDTLWSDHIRYLGVGIMLIAGLWTMLTLVKPIFKGIQASLQSMHARRNEGTIRTERDMPFNYIMWSMLLLLVPIVLLTANFVTPANLGINNYVFSLVVLVGLLAIIIIGFIVTSVAGYFAGLVGSSNAPISGVLIAGMILIAAILLAILAPHVNLKLHPDKAEYAAGLAVLLVAVIGCAGGLASDTMQDFKAGQMVGATPWKQQFMLILGVAASALIIPLVLNLLYNAYGIGGVYPRTGMDPNQTLTAPQAALLAAIAEGMFHGSLNWNVIGAGVIIGAIGIIIDEILKPRGYRLSVLSIGFGVYLPIDVTTPLILGGFLAYFVNLRLNRKMARGSSENQQALDRTNLLACGLVAGASLAGVALAIPFAIFKSADVLTIMPNSLAGVATIIGVISTIYLVYLIYKTAVRSI